MFCIVIIYLNQKVRRTREKDEQGDKMLIIEDKRLRKVNLTGDEITIIIGALEDQRYSVVKFYEKAFVQILKKLQKARNG